MFFKKRVKAEQSVHNCRIENVWNSQICEAFPSLIKFEDENRDYNHIQIKTEIFQNKIDVDAFNNLLARSYFLKAIYLENAGKDNLLVAENYRQAVLNYSSINQRYMTFWANISSRYTPEQFLIDMDTLIDKYGVTNLGYYALFSYVELLGRRNEEKTIEIIREMLTIFPEEGIWMSPFLSHIAMKKGVCVDDKSRKAAKVFEILNKTDENTFLEFIENRNVAVIGNSNCEKGLGKGKKIDNYDLVIRFNNFSVDGEFSEDYGKKTDIWARVDNESEILRDITNDTKMVIIPKNISLCKEESFYDKVIQYDNQGVSVISYPSNLTEELSRLYGLDRPSFGVKMVYWIYKARGKLSREDFYGFSFTDQLKDWSNRHYFKLNKEEQAYNGVSHNWQLEKIVFEALLFGLPTLPEYGYFSLNNGYFKQIRLELTNICAYNCVCCYRELKRPVGKMSKNDLEIILGNIKGYCGEIHLHGHGDPMHLRDLPEKISLIREYCPYANIFFITTLGYQMDEVYIRSIIEAGLNNLSISFYGHDKDSYQKIHGINRFDLAKSNIMMLSKVASDYPNFKFWITRLDDEGLRKLLKKDESFEDISKPILSFLNENNICYFVKKLHNYGDKHNFYECKNKSIPCSIAWGNFHGILQISWQLNVIPCCFTVDDEIVFGNLKEHNLGEIFNSKKYRDFIFAIINDNLRDYPLCLKCQRDINGSDKEKASIKFLKKEKIENGAIYE